MRHIGIDLIEVPLCLEPTHTLWYEATAAPRVESRIANESLPLNYIMSTTYDSNPAFAPPSDKTPSAAVRLISHKLAPHAIHYSPPDCWVDLSRTTNMQPRGFVADASIIEWPVAVGGYSIRRLLGHKWSGRARVSLPESARIWEHLCCGDAHPCSMHLG